MTPSRAHILVTGTVQGVGFRPFVYTAATRAGLTGWVTNALDGVHIEVQGPPSTIEAFADVLRQEAPPLARVEQVRLRQVPIHPQETEFVVGASQTDGRAAGASIPPDVASCRECLRDVLDPASRHYYYPFTNCTQCGPRFTVIDRPPYDRTRTTMAGFALCDDCAGEYNDPVDRRFHAQPVACPACGPQLSLLVAGQPSIDGEAAGTRRLLGLAGDLLLRGRIIAIKGLGGYHLACDAADEAAVVELRRRKQRPYKPLAVMCRDMAEVRGICDVTPRESELLLRARAPVVLLRKAADGRSALVAATVAPGLDRIGVLLPYTPLHHLLMRHSPPRLVMTSGNLSGLPLEIDESGAMARLAGIADAFLTHNRPIRSRCDDSVAIDVGADAGVLLVRRSRGWTPEPIVVDGFEAPVPILAVGGDQKSALCLFYGNQALLSQHIGDVETVEGEEFLSEACRHLVELAGVRPAVIAADLHPGYRSRRIAEALASDYAAPVRLVQHHAAHFATTLADCGHGAEAIGAILDGTGYGGDGQIWGFEIMSGSPALVRRHYCLRPVPAAGGDWGIGNPMVSAVVHLIGLLGERGGAAAERLFGAHLPELPMLRRLLEARHAAPGLPQISSCGRLFDAVAAIVGVCMHNTYDGQAPAELGSLVTDRDPEDSYPFELAGRYIDPGPTLAAVLDDVRRGTPKPTIAHRFHNSVARMVLRAVGLVREQTGLSTVALAGGCWYNAYLTSAVVDGLRSNGYTVLLPRNVPANDGGLSLGQAVVLASEQGAET